MQTDQDYEERFVDAFQHMLEHIKQRALHKRRRRDRKALREIKRELARLAKEQTSSDSGFRSPKDKPLNPPAGISASGAHSWTDQSQIASVTETGESDAKKVYSSDIAISSD